MSADEEAVGRPSDAQILSLARRNLDQGLCLDREAHITRATDAEILAFARKVLLLGEIGSVHAGMRYRAGNTALLEALMDMVAQFIGHFEPEATFSHSYISAEEEALRILVESGVAEQIEGRNEYRLLWDALEARKASQRPDLMTWAQAVELCIPDEAERERLLALGEEAELHFQEVQATEKERP